MLYRVDDAGLITERHDLIPIKVEGQDRLLDPVSSDLLYPYYCPTSFAEAHKIAMEKSRWSRDYHETCLRKSEAALIWLEANPPAPVSDNAEILEAVKTDSLGGIEL